jgi:hypothetical protein
VHGGLRSHADSEPNVASPNFGADTCTSTNIIRAKCVLLAGPVVEGWFKVS